MAFERLARFLGKKNKGPKEGDTRNVPVHFQDDSPKGEDRYHHEQHTFKDGEWERTGTVMPIRQKNQERMHEYKEKLKAVSPKYREEAEKGTAQGKRNATRVIKSKVFDTSVKQKEEQRRSATIGKGR